MCIIERISHEKSRFLPRFGHSYDQPASTPYHRGVVSHRRQEISDICGCAPACLIEKRVVDEHVDLPLLPSDAILVTGYRFVYRAVADRSLNYFVRLVPSTGR